MPEKQKNTFSMKGRSIMNKKIILIAAALLALLLTACVGFAEENTTPVQVGDYVVFGMYEQDNDLTNGPEPIEWRVLLIDGNEAQLVARYALDAQPYNEKPAVAMWTKCTLRTWLNTVFYDAAFTDAQKQFIVTKEIVNRKEPTSADPVYLLSCDEAKKLFANHPDRQTVPTAYAIAQGAYQSKKYGPGNSQWWLRTNSWESRYRAAYVAGSGGVMTCGGNSDGRVENEKWGVRPAIYISLDAFQQ